MRSRTQPRGACNLSSLRAGAGRWLMALAFIRLCAPALGAAVFPGGEWAHSTPAQTGLDETRLLEARDYALTGGGSGYVVRHGKLVLAWGDPARRYDLKSTTKSFGSAALGLALLDGKVRLDDKARVHHPALGIPPESNRNSGWLDEISLRQLAAQTAGFEKPGGYTPLLFKPGTQWDYSDSGPNWLAECLTLAYRRDLDELLFERLFAPLGIRREDLVWRKNAYRPERIDGIMRREFGSGISANVDAMARFGLLWLRRGDWNGRRLIPGDFVDQAARTTPDVAGLPVRAPREYGNASEHYGFLWWNNADGTLPDVPRNTYWSWGLYDSLIVVFPALDMVVARAGQSWPRTPGADHYAVLKPFLTPLVKAAGAIAPANPAAASPAPPYPASPAIRGIRWAVADSIIRLAPGSDNWPTTWTADGSLFAAYGDGRGFEPFVERKLSLGLAKIFGAPPDIRGVNVRSPTAESVGDGPQGRKASGLLCIGGVLYLCARNCANSQLAWSEDHGASWSWAGWNFSESFGCPTFLNFGRDYAGARDHFVYLYSHDQDSAYERADRFVLARAPKDRIQFRDAWTFFEGLDAGGSPRWTHDIARRGAVFVNPGRCYRSAISYNAGLKRYLWCQIGEGEDTRFRGGLAIYDAPEPWGPWTTVYDAPQWDVGPGETASLPTAWMSADGRSVHLLFSGEDACSVRHGELLPAEP